MTQDKKTKILDCTIRDGGYLNDWHFDLKLVRELYRAHSRSGVDFVEIGFRSTEKYFDPKKYGPWRFTPETLVSEVVKGISGPAVSLMVDFGKVDIEDVPDRMLLKYLGRPDTTGWLLIWSMAVFLGRLSRISSGHWS